MTAIEATKAEPGRHAQTPQSSSSPSRVDAAIPRPPVSGRRNPKWIALGVAALCLGALGSFLLYRDLAKSQTVVAVTETVYRGAVVQARDLTTVTVGSTPGIQTVPAGDLEVLVGQRATVDLVAGSLLPAGALAPEVVPRAKRAVVGVNLATGRAPSGFLTPGSPVRLVALPPQGAEPGYQDKYTNLAISASVVDTVPTPDELSLLLNVDVGADQAVTVGLLAAQDRLVVVRDAER